MKKYTLSFVCCLAAFFTAVSIHAQQGFTGPFQPGQPGVPGQFPPAPGQHGGFTGPVQVVTVAQVQSLPDKAPAILRGNIVAALGGDRYLFRDDSGEIVIKIKHDRWWGLSVGPNDLVELGGELKRDKKTWMINYFDAKTIRMAI